MASTPRQRAAWRHTALTTALVSALSPFTPVHAADPPPAPSAPSAAAPGAAPRPNPAGPAFAEVVRDAKRSDGYFPLWSKDEKVWVEIPADRLNAPFFFASSVASGLGERFFWPGLMGRSHVVVLRKVGNTVQLVAKNLQVRAPDNTPLNMAVAESYSDSLLASAPVASAPHPERKSFLVDAMALFGGDLTGAQTQLESQYRMAYSLDRANSQVTQFHSQAAGTGLTVRGHFSVPKLPAPPVMAPGAPAPNPAALPQPPVVVPDARSLFLSYSYTLAPLPAQPMSPRLADQRVGYFTESFTDMAKDDGGDRRTHYIKRWRLEKADPQAAVSKPKEPIRVVMDRNIPDKWREPIKAGILEWNKAFEKAGFKDALVVEQQAADTDWTTLAGTRMLAVRWFAIEGPGATAVGPSQADPRTGEILRGASIIPENWVRVGRTRLADTQPRVSGANAHAGHDHGHHDAAEVCTLGTDALAQAEAAFELLVARGLMDPSGPAADKFIATSLKDVTMHEVGHALGLRHNFKASTGIKPSQLRDAGFVAANGISNSVMDYNALNLALDGEPVTELQMTGLGAYDQWAIEYGYREFPADQEAQALASLAQRGETDPALAYATDEDAEGPDPMVNRFDLGEDPLAFAQRQLQVTRELWSRTSQRVLGPNDDLTLYRRVLQRVFAGYNATVPLATRYVGGVLTQRATAGANKPLYTPVPAARQRQALDLVVKELFSSSSFRFDPKILSRLGADQQDRISARGQLVGTEFNLGQAVLGVQRRSLDNLMNDALATRLAEADHLVESPKGLMSFADVQQRLHSAIWAELKSAPGTGRDIDSLRRNLQREHLKRVVGGLLRPSGPGTHADVPAVNRMTARGLEAELRAALAAGGWNAISRAHLEDSLASLGEALKASLNRQGV